MDLREQNFGIEIEMTGITREEAAQSIGDYFGTRPHSDGGYYDEYSVRDEQGRKWKFMYDSSITSQKKYRGRRMPADKEYRVELVSPICKYEDIDTIQELVRVLRNDGAFVNTSCGIHIHINASPFNSKQIRNLVNIVAAKEDMLYRSLQVDRWREEDYCRKVDTRFLNELNQKKPKTMEALKKIWYDGTDGSNQHYHSSCYRCLNLHSVFQKGTIEFRAFNGNLHAGKIKAYIQFCLAVAAQAHNQKSASMNKTVSTNEKYTFRVWLLRLGMIGDEFKTARLHLLNHLEGNVAWKNPEQAEKQKERLRKQREIESRSQENMDESVVEEEHMDELEQEETSAFTMSM